MTGVAALPVPEPRPRIAAVLKNAAGLTIELLDNGAVFAIRHGRILVNQVLGSPAEGGLGNVYLRRRTRGGAAFVPLLGPAASGRFRADGDGATWEGSFDELDYTCTLRLHPTAPTWFWSVEVVNRTGRRLSFDAVLAQDLGLAHEGVVRSSEAYASQYIDHTVLRAGDLGVVLCSRQNMPQDGAVPWIMHGCLDGAAGFLTDGVQLYGLQYRATNVPAALGRLTLPNRVYQYELALPTIRSRSVPLRAGATGRITFFAAFEADHPAATGPPDVAGALRAAEAFASLPRLVHGVEPRPRLRRGRGCSTRRSCSPAETSRSDELERWFGADWRHVERRDGELLSFFHGYQQHVVLRAKELISERPTGLIMRSGRDVLPSDETLSSHCLDVRRVRVPGGHRQHVLQQAAERLAAPAQRAEVQRPTRLREVRRAVRAPGAALGHGDGPEQRALDLRQRPVHDRGSCRDLARRAGLQADGRRGAGRARGAAHHP